MEPLKHKCEGGKKGEDTERKGGGTTGNEGRKTRAEEEFAGMCLRSFSISTEVLFIRLKPIIYAAAEGGGKNNGETVIQIVATVGDTDTHPGRESRVGRGRRESERKGKNGMRCNSCN